MYYVSPLVVNIFFLSPQVEYGFCLTFFLGVGPVYPGCPTTVLLHEILPKFFIILEKLSDATKKVLFFTKLEGAGPLK